VRWRPTGRRRARRAKPRSNTCNMLLSPPGPSTSPIDPWGDYPAPSSLPTLPITITHSILVRQAPSLVTGEEQNQCCWQGRHELQAWRLEFTPDIVSRPASPVTLAHATCTCTYACAYVPIHVHAYVSLKQPVRFYST
jgi:hypothetical protein